MGLLIVHNIAHWYDFCHIKNAKLALPLQCPIKRIQFNRGEFGVHRANTDSKLVCLHMGHLIVPNAYPRDDFCHKKSLKNGPTA